MEPQKPKLFKFVFADGGIMGFVGLIVLFALAWGILPFFWSAVPRLNSVEVFWISLVLLVGLSVMVIDRVLTYGKLYGKK